MSKKLTATIAEVDVETPDGETEGRVAVVFNDFSAGSKSVSPEGYLQSFTDELPPGVQVYIGTGGAHAEDAEAAFRDDPGLQESSMGGTMTRVGNFYTSNNMCSGPCANHSNYFAYEEDAEDWMAPGDQGDINGVTINKAAEASLKTDYGHQRTIDNVIEMLDGKPTIAEQQQAAVNAEVNDIVDGIIGDTAVGTGDDETVSEMEDW